MRPAELAAASARCVVPSLFLILGLMPGLAWSSPTLVSATLSVCVDDQAEFWVNGVHEATVPYTPVDRGQAVVKLRDLCAFSRSNVLAFRVDDTGETEVGISYVLRLEFSEGPRIFLSSGEEDQHRCFWIKDSSASEPMGWMFPEFNDTAWGKAFNLGAYFPNMTNAADSIENKDARFMSASGESTHDQQVGERHYFRRTFTLDIVQNGRCITPSPTNTETPIRERTATLTQTATASPTFPRTWTPVRKASPTASRTPAIVKGPTRFSFTATPTASSRPWKSPTSVPIRTRTPYRTWTPTAAIRIVSPEFRARVIPTATKTESPGPTRTPMPVPASRKTTPKPSQEKKVFDHPPLVFFAQFVEPGDYRIEVFDAQNRLKRVLFEGRVSSRREEWIEWDGKDTSGLAVPAGEYTVLYQRNGRLLREMTAVLLNP